MTIRILSRPCWSISVNRRATPLMKGSQPIKPICGLDLARAAKCSPAPKPISSQTDSMCLSNSDLGSIDRGAKLPGSICSRGRRRSSVASRPWRKGLPRRRPKRLQANDLAKKRLQLWNQIQPLPTEMAVIGRLLAEMTIGCRRPVNGTVQPQHIAYTPGA